jgi:hypothetical protein
MNLRETAGSNSKKAKWESGRPAARLVHRVFPRLRDGASLLDLPPINSALTAAEG